MSLIPGFLRSTSKEIDILRHDVAIFKNLIKERQHPLDLVRELISNAGARQVGASRIEVAYTKDQCGHIFEVSDNGCGMDFAGTDDGVGRLARFLGLGLSGIAGEKADEFSWKGLGSKLAFQSRRVVVETRSQGHPLYEVRINEPWEELDHGVVPRPRITEHADPDCPTGTRIKVLGHPPHRQEEPFSLDEIRRFLLHRTFVGFTRARSNPPAVLLSVLGEIDRLEFGFPEFKGIEFPAWLALDSQRKTLLVNMSLLRPPTMQVRLKGLITWDPAQFDLREENLNTGLILSSRGIPFFELPLPEYGSVYLHKSQPGRTKVCLVAECDEVFSEMNISRSALIDSALTLTFKHAVRQLVEHLESSIEYREFRQLRARNRHAKQAAALAQDRSCIESDEQKWVVLVQPGAAPRVLMREPRNDDEAVAILSKLETLGALPFNKFQTVALPAGPGAPDLFVNFQEEAAGGEVRPQLAAFEAENRFYSYRHTKDAPSACPNVICWDIPSRGRRVRLNKTGKKYKFTLDAERGQIPVYVMKLMDGLSVMSARELHERGIPI